MSIIEKLVGDIEAKKEFREYRKRGAALPKEYRVVWKEIEQYFFNCGPMDGSIDMLNNIVTLFEESAGEGRRVLDITGNDVIAFCDGLIHECNGSTWQDQVRKKFNKQIHNKLAELNNERD